MLSDSGAIVANRRRIGLGCAILALAMAGCTNGIRPSSADSPAASERTDQGGSVTASAEDPMKCPPPPEVASFTVEGPEGVLTNNEQELEIAPPSPLNLTVEVDVRQGFDLDDVQFELVDYEGSEPPFPDSLPLAPVANLSAGLHSIDLSVPAEAGASLPAGRFRLAATYTAITVAEPVGTCDPQIGHESHGGAGLGHIRVPEPT